MSPSVVYYSGNLGRELDEEMKDCHEIPSIPYSNWHSLTMVNTVFNFDVSSLHLNTLHSFDLLSSLDLMATSLPDSQVASSESYIMLNHNSF